MTRRDRIVLAVVLAAAAVVGSYMFAIKGKQSEASKLGSEVTAQRQLLQEAQATLTASKAAKSAYPSNYASVARLGKAVPLDDDVPSLVYQLSSTAAATHVDFRTLKLSGGGSSTPPPAPAAAPAPAPAASSSSSASSGSTPPAAGSTPGATPPAAGATSSATSSTPAAGTAPGAAPAAQAATATLPPGASVGAAGFPTLPFSFTFQGNFIHLSNFFHRLERYVRSSGRRVDVTGRLLAIDGFSLNPLNGSLGNMKASVSATTYLLPADQGLTAGATPTAPAPGSTQTVAATSATAPPTATATAATP